ncbi:hypothetical protein BDR05DRAFT_944498 [Suillus weaverae]|nr:hypothetical protein BDR05DRAFT_944498 [Suillus weaverae]
MPTGPYTVHPSATSLPVELLQQIFLFIVNDAPDHPSIFSCGPDTISGVPLLASRGTFNSRSLVAHLGRTPRCWLVRSGSLPLTLRIVNGVTVPHAATTPAPIIITTLG